ncbi:MAG: glycosyltransferase [Deltaproteobacteria bacterium]|nr:glycosyltransferase [Deltaproteobacteria bacterium]
MPRVSVLLPVRDEEPTLAEALDSQLAQREADFEIVAVDDGSADASPSILDAFADRDRRVRVVRQEASGIVAALQNAVTHASGDILARMDADDSCPPDRLAKQLALLRSDPSLGLVGTQVGPMPGERWGGGWRHYAKWQNALTTPDAIAREIWAECPIAHPSWMMTRAAYDASGGYRERGWPEDYDLLLSMHRAGVRFAKVDEVLLRWRDRPDRLSRTDDRYSPDAFARCKAHHLARGPLAGVREVGVWGAGRTTRKRAEHLVVEGIEIAAYVDVDPKKIGHLVHGRPVLAPADIPRPAPWPMLAYVGSRGAREQIRAVCRELGFVEGTDILICG